MAKIKNLSPKFKIPVAEKELELQKRQIAMGSQQGGLSMYSNKFKRGYGDAVFGSDGNGIWLGAAEFADAPFSVNMDGALAAKSAIFKDEDNTTIIDAKGLISTASFPVYSSTRSSWQSHTATSWTNVPNTNTLTFTLTRSAKAYVSLTVIGSSEQVSGGSDCSGGTYYRLNDSVNGELTRINYDSFLHVANDVRENIISSTYSSSAGVSLSSGDHVVRIQSKLDSVVNFRSILNKYYMSLIILGT